MNHVFDGRLVRVVAEAVEALQLQLPDLRLVTEAATGPYASTAVLGAVAGARVTALARDSRHGTAVDASQAVMQLADRLGVAQRISIVGKLTPEVVGTAHIITNSGHIRPLDTVKIGWMNPTAVIPVMYEGWELRKSDIDLAACRSRGVRVVATNERHPDVGVFDYLGPMTIKALLSAGCELVGERCLVLSDNDFGPYLAGTLEANRAKVTLAAPTMLKSIERTWDCIVVAATPPITGGAIVDLQGLTAHALCQVWGDVRRESAHGQWLPSEPPPPGHMGLQLANLGPTPVVRLQTAGLKTAEIALRSTQPRYEQLAQWIVPETCPVGTRP